MAFNKRFGLDKYLNYNIIQLSTQVQCWDMSTIGVESIIV